MHITSPSTEDEFKQYYHLRWKLLRAPWNEPEGSEKDDDEDSSFHIMAVDGNRIIGVARMQNITPIQAQVRYMAVDDDYQGRGVGRKIMHYIEDYARDHHIEEIFLHARENAVPFYNALGYQHVEKSYLLFGSIQHYKMNKVL